MHYLIVVLVIFSLTSTAQSVSTRMGARAAGLGKAGFAITDGSSLFQNAASLGFLDQSTCFFGYELAPELPGANRTAAGVSFLNGSSAFSLGAFRFGDDLYSEQFITTAFSHRLEHTALGIKGNLIQYRADGFGTRTAFTVDVSGLTQLTPEWSVGAGIFNLNQAALIGDETLPVVLIAALTWHQSEGPLLTIEAEKQAGVPLRVSCGMEVTLLKKLYLRTGFGLQPTLLAVGLGARSRRLQVDFSTTYHPTFQFIYQTSAILNLRKNTKT
jgi:hypothetical protein